MSTIETDGDFAIEVVIIDDIEAGIQGESGEFRLVEERILCEIAVAVKEAGQ